MGFLKHLILKVQSMRNNLPSVYIQCYPQADDFVSIHQDGVDGISSAGMG